MTKLRISAHKLAIETGRYARPFIPSNMRKCLLCDSGEVEDEFHFLFNCTSPKNERAILFESAYENCALFSIMNKVDKLKYLLSCEGKLNQRSCQILQECL